MISDADAEFNSLAPGRAVSRRTFLAGSAAAGFTLASGHAIAQTAIRTPDDGLDAGFVTIASPAGDVRAYRAQPAGKTKLPTVLVVSEIFGVHAYIQDVCRRLARDGYQAIAPDLFARIGDATSYTDMARLRAEIIDKVPDAQALVDLDATAGWARDHGGDAERFAITGFCWGGRIAWLYCAHNPAVKAGAAWYGQVRGKTDALKPEFPIDVVARLHAPVLGAYGEADAGIPVADVEAMRAALTQGSAAAKASRIELYANAPHAFHADYRPSYREADAQAAWARMLDWFDTRGV